MGFMVGKSSAKPSLKLHLLWRENLSFNVVNRARTMSKLCIYCNYSIIFKCLLYWQPLPSRCRSKIVRSLLWSGRLKQS